MNSVYSVIQFEMIFFVFFGNGHFHNVSSVLTNVVKLEVEKNNIVSTLSNVVHINVEINNDVSTFFNVVNSNVEIQNVVSTLIWCCPTLWRHINQKPTLKQRWNVCWDIMYNTCIKMHNSCIYFWDAYNSEMHVFLKRHEYTNNTWKKILIWILLKMSNHSKTHYKDSKRNFVRW